MRISNLTVESDFFTVAKVEQKDGDWIYIYQNPNVDGAGHIVVWEGTAEEFLYLRILINKFHEVLGVNPQNYAFPAHKPFEPTF